MHVGVRVPKAPGSAARAGGAEGCGDALGRVSGEPSSARRGSRAASSGFAWLPPREGVRGWRGERPGLHRPSCCGAGGARAAAAQAAMPSAALAARSAQAWRPQTALVGGEERTWLAMPGASGRVCTGATGGAGHGAGGAVGDEGKVHECSSLAMGSFCMC